ncbi:hypothetical protein BV25DRAFT_1836006 [Artomyces pyxidatus]|uniref:Uncharacterized protein n=1 Tax=Artomyces pyxidatus TaxID=48021 RepID=A0ACB8TAT8_9AGAM|nr:hypothetical protein BV25DRAFT_1836006 [Artomyces pyxidatus]
MVDIVFCHSMEPRLPPELWLRTLALMPRADLLSLRAVDKALHALATPAIFRELKCTSAARSTAALRALIGSSVGEHVEKIEYRDWHAGKRVGRISDVPTYYDEQITVREDLVAIIALLPALPALHSLAFVFDPTVNFGNILRGHLALQGNVFAALAALPSPLSLRTLVLDNLLPYTDDYPALLAIFRGLQDLTVTCHHANWNPANAFYSITLPTLLRAPADTLTSLSLRSTRDIGFPPGISLSGLRYPRLTHLSLECIVFDENTGVEEFILTHAATLTSLSLNYCRIARPERGGIPGRPWVVVYGALSAGLDNLRHLKVEEESLDGGQGGDYVLRYAMTVRSWGPQSTANWHASSGGDKVADAAALEAFSAVVLRRRLEWAHSSIRV